MASPLLAPDLEYRAYRNEDDEACKALEMKAMQGLECVWALVGTQQARAIPGCKSSLDTSYEPASSIS